MDAISALDRYKMTEKLAFAELHVRDAIKLALDLGDFAAISDLGEAGTRIRRAKLSIAPTKKALAEAQTNSFCA